MTATDCSALQDELAWRCCRFKELTATEFHHLVKLRLDVFVVEQHCPYPELDGQDLLEDTVHLFATRDSLPIAYARILAPSANQPTPLPLRIGRVVVASGHRRQGLATALMRRVITHCESAFAEHEQTLAAQLDVKDFYTGLGFVACSEPYLEDGIEHIDMRRAALSST